jgi:DNA replication protein DnaC
LRATFSPDSLVRFDKQFSELRNTPLLILDDLSMESATPWAKEKLMQLIDHRYVTRLPTVITTSVDKADLGTRLESRLLNPQISTICPITAPMYKGKKGFHKHNNKA